MVNNLKIKEVLKDLAPEFANEDDSKLDRFIAYSQAEVDVLIFGTEDNIDYKKAIALLSASKIKISTAAKNTSVGGVFIDVKAGNLEKKHNNAGSSLAKSLTDNPYQEEFQRLVDMYRKKEIFLI